MHTFDEQPCDISGNPITYKMETLLEWGHFTESEAKACVRDLDLNKHEADEGVYSYEHSANYPGLFCIVKYTW